VHPLRLPNLLRNSGIRRPLARWTQDIYLEIFDAAHSDAEDRFIAIGEIDRGIAVVVYTEREEDLIRIIGARFANERERERFYKHMDQYR